jgi:NADP-dependent 3-hydroxy acid dehydrogenase YdfG
MEENGSRYEVVVVTGASAGVGRAVSRRFARHGARIGLLARGIDRLEAARREVSAAGGRAIAIPTDVASADQVESAARAVEEKFGPIDVWINNAMASVFAPVRATTPEEYRRVTEVTYLGAVHGTQAALASMVPRARGVIVQVGSALAHRSIPLQSAYCAAKHALHGFTESLRSELLHDRSRVRLTEVHLPALNTPQFRWVRSRLPCEAQPVPPIYQPEVAAEAIYWAAHHYRRELYVGWSTAKAILANKVAPATVDRVLARRGYEAQQTEGPLDRTRPDNLWEPPPGDPGARGVFDDRARDLSVYLWASQNRGWVALAAAGMIGIAAASLASRRGRAARADGA